MLRDEVDEVPSLTESDVLSSSELSRGEVEVGPAVLVSVDPEDPWVSPGLGSGEQAAKLKKSRYAPDFQQMLRPMNTILE